MHQHSIVTTKKLSVTLLVKLTIPPVFYTTRDYYLCL